MWILFLSKQLAFMANLTLKLNNDEPVQRLDG